jgi:hypothetical protein
MNTPQNPKSAGKELSPELRDILMAIGRGLGTISVYGPEHPSVTRIIEESFKPLQETLNKRRVTLGSVNGGLTVNEEPVVVTEMPIRTLEKRLVSMKVSHLVLRAGLSQEEFKQLLLALSASSSDQMKETLAKKGAKNIELEDVKYVTLRKGEKKAGIGGSGDGGSNIPQAQISQIVAFLKGEPGSNVASTGLKQAMADPQKLGQMILEAAAVRQKTGAIEQGESLADIVMGCLRRTYDGLTQESEFRSAQGKATLAKTMMLVEKTIIDKIRGSGTAESPGLEQRILAGIRDMGKERQFDMLSTHYEEQCLKRKKTEETLTELIKQIGPERAREKLLASGIPTQDWHRLMAQPPPSSSSENSGGSGGLDISAIATVLDKLDGLLQLAETNPTEAKNKIQDARQGIDEYSSLANAKIHEIEERVQESSAKERDKLILEISKLTLSLMQPLTVINGSIEAAMATTDASIQKDLLELAYESGQSLDKMTKRMIELTDFPELNEADDHLNEWH